MTKPTVEQLLADAARFADTHGKSAWAKSARAALADRLAQGQPAWRAILQGLLEIEDARIGTGAFTPNAEAARRIDAARTLLAETLAERKPDWKAMDRVEEAAEAAFKILSPGLPYTPEDAFWYRQVVHAVLEHCSPAADAEREPDWQSAKVSIDVSTCDDDAGHRVFGRVVDWQPEDYDGNKPIGLRLLCEYESDNFGMRRSPAVTRRVDDHMTRARRLVENHIEAYGMVPHPDRIKEAIAEQTQEAFDLGFQAAGGSCPSQPETDYILPCDVQLPPATTVTKGCTLSTLMAAFKVREKGWPEVSAEQVVAVNELLKSEFGKGDWQTVESETSKQEPRG